MKIVYQGKTDDDTIVEVEDAFEAVFDPKEAEERRLLAMAARQHRSGGSESFACES